MKVTYQGQCVEALSVSLRLEHQAELVNLGNVLLGHSARVTGLRVGSLGREVIVVVLWVDIHIGGLRRGTRFMG